jgi:hypothetical protein
MQSIAKDVMAYLNEMPAPERTDFKVVDIYASALQGSGGLFPPFHFYYDIQENP